MTRVQAAVVPYAELEACADERARDGIAPVAGEHQQRAARRHALAAERRGDPLDRLQVHPVQAEGRVRVGDEHERAARAAHDTEAADEVPDRPVGLGPCRCVAGLEVGEQLGDRWARAPEEAGADVQHQRGVLLGGCRLEQRLDRRDREGAGEPDRDAASGGELGDRAHEPSRRGAGDLGSCAGMRQAIVLAARLSGREVLVVALRPEHAAGRLADRVLVEGLVAGPDAREPQGEQGVEGTAQLVLLRQLLGVQPRQLGRAREEAGLGAEHQ